jgi:uncharacterized membrane protein YqjE
VSLLGSVHGVLDSAAALARTRLELLGAELQQELNGFLLKAVAAFAALLLAALGVAMAAVALLMAVSPADRVWVSAALALLMLGAAAFVGWRIRAVVPRKPLAFTLAELERDREALRAALVPVAKADHVMAGVRNALGWAVQLLPALALLRRR